MSTQVEMETLPKCDFCPSTAQYDTKMKIGPWAYTCSTCYDKWGIRTLIDGRYTVGKLGTGYGQKLITKEVK